VVVVLLELVRPAPDCMHSGAGNREASGVAGMFTAPRGCRSPAAPWPCLPRQHHRPPPALRGTVRCLGGTAAAAAV
jgi:hypothetical protein